MERAESMRRVATIGRMSSRAKIRDVGEPRSDQDLRYVAQVIPTNLLAVLAQVGTERGLAVEPWFADMGLTREQINDPALRVSYRQASLIVKRALRAMPQSNIGLEVGRRQTIGTFGVLGLAMMTARTFGEAMAIGIEHHQVGGSLMDMELEIAGPGEVAMTARPRFADDEILLFTCEELFASAVIACRGLIGPSFRPLRLELTYPAPPHAAEYRALFQSEIRFGASQNRALVDARWMEFELPTHHPVSAQQALALCREQSKQLARQSEVVSAVERILRQRLTQSPRVSEVARSMNLTERTLRRQLAAAGKIYRDIHDRIRSERAKELLRAGALSVADIGNAVGFSDPREFRRAFKRWNGVPPSEMRV